MESCNATLTPMSFNADLQPGAKNEDVLRRSNHRLFSMQIGDLLYLAICTLPDISFAVCALACSLHAPTNLHDTMLSRDLRYLSATENLGLNFARPSSNPGLCVYSDSDWAGCEDTRQPTTGFVVTLNGIPISWRSFC